MEEVHIQKLNPWLFDLHRRDCLDWATVYGLQFSSTSGKPFLAAQTPEPLIKLIKDELSEAGDLSQLDSTNNTSLPAALAFAGDKGNASILAERFVVARESGIVQKGVGWDGCKDGVDIKGPRFGYRSCVDLDLCQGCFKY